MGSSPTEDIDAGPYLRTGPGPGRQIFRAGILKKSRLKYGMQKKKGCPRERNLREIYTENNVGTEFYHYGTTGASRSWGYCLTERNWIWTNGGGHKNFLGPGA